MTPVSYHEAAEGELLSEIGYLELRAGGLGRRFFAEVRRAENPSIAKAVAKICGQYGCECPGICTPEELLKE